MCKMKYEELINLFYSTHCVSLKKSIDLPDLYNQYVISPRELIITETILYLERYSVKTPYGISVRRAG